MEIGESKNFNLHAPDGTYLIMTNDGGNTSVLGNTVLTGNAIGVSSTEKNLSDILSNPGVWFMIIISVVGIIGLFNGKKVLKFGKKIKLSKRKNVRFFETSIIKNTSFERYYN